MHHLRITVKHVLYLRQPRLCQAANLGIIAQNALHDDGFFFALLRQQLVLLRLEAQLLNQHRARALVAHHFIPIFGLGSFQHFLAAVFNRFVVVNEHGGHG